MKELFENLTSILSFGFLGLSFLMLYLGFRGMQTINESSDPNPAQVSLTRFYLIISLVFMIVAGPLQFLLLYAESAFKPAVVLYLGAPSTTLLPCAMRLILLSFYEVYVRNRIWMLDGQTEKPCAARSLALTEKKSRLSH